MKKIFFAGFVFAALVSYSCAKQEIASPEEGSAKLEKMVFGAGMETLKTQTDLKSYISDWSARTQYWAQGDSVSLFSENVNYKFVNTLADGTEAEFTGEAEPSASYVAVYPYREDATISDGKVSVVLPAEQTSDTYGTDPSALIKVASSQNGDLVFRNLFSLVKFSITETDVTSVIIEGNNDEVIAGTISVTPGQTPSWTVVKGEKTIVFNSPDGNAFTTGDYAVAVLPQTFTKGLRLILKKDGQVKCSVKSSSSKIDAERSAGIALPSSIFVSPYYKYYYIMNKADLDAFFKDSGSWASTDVAYLGADIDYNKGSQAHNKATFSGTFDGRQHRIYNIHGTGVSARAGFFFALTGTMKNVCIGSKDYDFSKGSAADAGTYDGHSYYKITGCAGTGTSNSWYYVGLVAYVNSKGRMENVVNFCDIQMLPTTFSTAPYCYRAGGIAGTMKGSTTITGCVNYGRVYNNDKNGENIGTGNFHIGGIVSTNDGTDAVLTDCVNRGDVTNYNTRYYYTGGIIGAVANAMEVSGCENYGAVADKSVAGTSTRYVGGIAGGVTVASAAVKDCDNYGKVSVSGESCGSVGVGGILGYNSKGAAAVSNCENKAGADVYVSADAIEGDSTGRNMCIGGILGWGAVAVNLSGCTNSASVSMTGTNNASGDIRIGGAIGGAANGGTMSGCRNDGDISVISAHKKLVRVGGFVGSVTNAALNITDCHCGEVTISSEVTSDVTLATLQLSGICGYQGTGSPTFKDCTSKAVLVHSGNVTSSNLYQVVSYYPAVGETTIDNCKISGSVDGTVVTKDNFQDYICPSGSNVKIQNCGSGTFSLSSNEVIFNSLGGSKTVQLSADKDWTASSSEDWLTVSPEAGTAGTAPVTVNLTATEYSLLAPRTATVTISAGADDYVRISVTQTAGDMFEGAGTRINPYKITKPGHLKTLASFVNSDVTTAKNYKSAYYVIENDLDFSGITDYEPIGISAELDFCGSIDGQNHTISNFSCDGSEIEVAGLVGIAGEGSSISNITFAAPKVSAKYQAGVVAGFLNGGTISGCKVTDGSVYSTTNITLNSLGVSCTAGIAGRAFKGTITKCEFSGNVVAIGNQSSGICAYADASTISSCKVLKGSEITSAYYTGGIVAKLLSTDSIAKSSVTSCVFEGCALVKNWGCGGIVSNLNGGVVKDCVMAGCAEVKSNSYYCGGIVGIVNNTTDGVEKVATIDNCAAYGSVQGGYDCASILGYSSYPSGYTLNVVNCAALSYEVVSKSNNGGSNLFALLGGVAGYVTGAGKANIVNCCSAPGLLNSISESNGGIGGIVGYSSPTTGLVDNCFSRVSAGDIVSHNAPISSSTITKWGAVVGRSNSAGSSFYRCYFNESVPFGAMDNGKKDASCQGVSAAEISDGTLVSQLNGNISSLTAISGVTFSNWTESSAGYPVIATVPADTNPVVLPSKKVSIIGDSISTFAGYSLPSYSIHYPNAKCDVLSVNQTWWHKLIYEKMSDARLDTNNSFGNTTVVRNTCGDNTQYWYGYDFCSRFITCAGVGNPDVIVIHGGTNDYGHNYGEQLYAGIAMRSETAPSDAQMSTIFSQADDAVTVAQSESLGSDTFAESYLKLVRMCLVRYPSVKIVCLVGDGLGQGMGEVVRMIANHYSDRVKYVDFLGTYGFKENTYVTKYDGTTHPDANGMQHMADFIYETVGSWID